MAGEWLLPPKIAFTIGLAFLRLPKSTSFPCQSVHEEMAHSNSVEKVLYARRAGNVKSMQRGRIKDMGGTLCAQIYMVYILLCIKYQFSQTVILMTAMASVTVEPEEYLLWLSLAYNQHFVRVEILHGLDTSCQIGFVFLLLMALLHKKVMFTRRKSYTRQKYIC